jgi:hypothetical protein
MRSRLIANTIVVLCAANIVATLLKLAGFLP